jgi:hypothetical protein
MNIIEAAKVWKNGGSVRLKREGALTLAAPPSRDMVPHVKDVRASPNTYWSLSVNDLLSEYEHISGPYWVIARLIDGEWCESWSTYYYDEEDAQAEMEDVLDHWGGDGALKVVRKEAHT